MNRKNIVFIFFLLAYAEVVKCQTVESFNSSGVYFHNMGEVLVEKDALILTTMISLEPYHQAIDVIKKTSVEYRIHCNKLNMKLAECDQDYNELDTSNKDLEKRLNNIYQILMERPPQKRRRIAGLIGVASAVTGVAGLAFGIYNTVKIKNMEKDIIKMRTHMDEQFSTIKSILDKQSETQIQLIDQQNEMNETLKIHEKKINELLERVGKMEQQAQSISKRIDHADMKIALQNIKLEILKVLGNLREVEQWMIDLTKNSLHPEIRTMQNITDEMMNYKIPHGRFLAPPKLENYNLIRETIAGFAFVMTKEKSIFVNLKIPIYQKEKLNLFEVIDVPVIKDRKILRISNNRDKYCVFSDDREQYDCMTGNHRLTKSRDFYLSDDDSQLSLLPTLKAKSHCIIDILTEKSLDNCKFKEIIQNIEIMKEIDTHKYLFAIRDATKYSYNCQNDSNDTNDKSLQGTGFVYLKENCNFMTDSGDTVIRTNSVIKNTWKKDDIFNFNELEEEIDDVFKDFKFKNKVETEKTKTNFEILAHLPNY
ncbi:hypothetical protein ACFFRR_008941 [Megaselia abdita]